MQLTRLLALTSPELQGEDVRFAQVALRNSGNLRGVVNSIFDPQTEEATFRFQVAEDLKVDGVIGPKTWAALTPFSNHPSKLLPSGPTPEGLAALKVAEKEVGTREFPLGSNCTKYGQWWEVDGLAWCAIFCSYCFYVGSAVILCGTAKHRLPGMRSKGCSYVPSLITWAQEAGIFFTHPLSPTPGDLIFFQMPGSKHIGLVSSVGSLNVRTIEGNAPNSVSRGFYAFHDQRILGYARVSK